MATETRAAKSQATNRGLPRHSPTATYTEFKWNSLDREIQLHRSAGMP